MDDLRVSNAGVTRLLAVFAVLSVVFVSILAIAPAKSQFTEWRAAQQQYNALAVKQNVAPIDVAVQQIWNSRLGVVDRCTSCHVGMGGGEPVGGDALFGAHPLVGHDPADLGCTLCHAGQGRATKKLAAHGEVKFWEEPMLERPYFEAGCGRCHTHLHVASPSRAERGAALFDRYDCAACHQVGKKGRGTGPDLSAIGTKGVAPAWHERHLSMATDRATPEWKASYGEIPAEERRDIEEYLSSLHGAPKLMAAKTLAYKLGCRGCHKINGIGGDEGPDLTNAGRRLAHDLDYSNVSGPHTLPTWLKAHFIAPDKVVPGSRMPPLGVSEKEAELLTLYILSLRPIDVPQEFWPKDRLLGERFKARDFAQDGESLYGVFCAACHGAKGEGRRYATTGVMPAIGSLDFLAVADDDFIRATITHGRPGRKMPAWGTKDGGLDREEIDRIVSYLRSLAPGTPEPWTATLPAGDAKRGADLYQRNCGGCHGAKGEGVASPELRNPAFLAAASDTFIARTILRGRRGSGMRHFGTASTSFDVLELADVADIVAFIRSFSEKKE